MSQPKRYRPVILSKDKVEMQQCVSGDWTSLSEYYLLHDRLNEAKDKNADLAAENERLRKAGDALQQGWIKDIRQTAAGRMTIKTIEDCCPDIAAWNAVKEGGAK